MTGAARTGVYAPEMQTAGVAWPLVTDCYLVGGGGTLGGVPGSEELVTDCYLVSGTRGR